MVTRPPSTSIVSLPLGSRAPCAARQASGTRCNLRARRTSVAFMRPCMAMGAWYSPTSAPMPAVGSGRRGFTHLGFTIKSQRLN
eukprot:3634701-Pyramimonas_sp.AAC.1